MFFVMKLHRQIGIEPRFFGPRLRDQIETKLREEAENTASEKYGFIVAVMKMDTDKLEGFIKDRDGIVLYNVPFTAIVFKPFKEEVLEGIVESCTKRGLFVDVGPLKVFISEANIPRKYTFESMPPSFVYNDENNEGEPARIEQDGIIRLKIIGIRESRVPRDYSAVGTLKGDFLGPLL